MRWIVFAALLAVSCASERALNVGDAARETERALSVGDTTWKEIRANGETISARLMVIEIAEYDSSGNMIRHVDYLEEQRHEYDDAGRVIHSKTLLQKSLRSINSSYIGEEEWHEYDVNGRKIRSRSDDGNETRYEYDVNGRKIRSRSDDGAETLYEYDANGNRVHATTAWPGSKANTIEEWREYDDNGKLTYAKLASERKSVEIHWQFDDKGNMIHERAYAIDPHLYPDEYPAGHTSERWLEYDEKGRPIHSKRSEGTEEWFEEEWFEYDDKGNRIGRRNSYGAIFRTDYTFWGNGKVKTSIEYRYIPGDDLRH